MYNVLLVGFIERSIADSPLLPFEYVYAALKNQKIDYLFDLSILLGITFRFPSLGCTVYVLMYELKG